MKLSLTGLGAISASDISAADTDIRSLSIHSSRRLLTTMKLRMKLDEIMIFHYAIHSMYTYILYNEHSIHIHLLLLSCEPE